MQSPEEIDELYSLAYEELRRLAAAVLHREVFASLSPTTLVHQAWIKLSGSSRMGAESPLHFKRIAARAMRQVLVDGKDRPTLSRRSLRGARPCAPPEITVAKTLRR